MADLGTNNRRDFLKMATLTSAGVFLGGCSPSAVATSTPLPVENEVSNPDDAWNRLVEGNARFVSKKTWHPNQTAARQAEVTQGQKPFAIIFGCVDSRVPPEMVFDRGLGDLFVIRTAGHVLDEAVLGSIEFGIEELKIQLVVVLGHASCDAVKATIELVEKKSKAPGAIAYLVEGIEPAFEIASTVPGDVIENTIRANTLLTVTAIKKSEIIKEAIKAKKLAVVGARYDLDSGRVTMM